jgi:hypothetical protein
MVVVAEKKPQEGSCAPFHFLKVENMRERATFASFHPPTLKNMRKGANEPSLTLQPSSNPQKHDRGG